MLSFKPCAYCFAGALLCFFVHRRLNDVPIPLIGATVFYFSLYHALSNMAIRKVGEHETLPLTQTVIFMFKGKPAAAAASSDASCTSVSLHRRRPINVLVVALVSSETLVCFSLASFSSTGCTYQAPAADANKQDRLTLANKRAAHVYFLGGSKRSLGKWFCHLRKQLEQRKYRP